MTRPEHLVDVLYLVRLPSTEPPASPSPSRGVPTPRRRVFIGSARFFLTLVVCGAALGLGALALLSTMRSGASLVWTERAVTWSAMLFAIMGALAGAVLSVVVDSVAHRRLRSRP